MKVERILMHVLTLSIIGPLILYSSVRAEEIPHPHHLCVSLFGEGSCSNSASIGNYIMTARVLATLKDIQTILAESRTHLSAINSHTSTTAQQAKDTQDTLKTMVVKFNEELRKTITTRFDQLPQEFAVNPAILQLKKEILAEVDKKIEANTQP